MDNILDQQGASSFIAAGAHDSYLNDIPEVKLFTPSPDNAQPTVCVDDSPIRVT